MRNWRGELSGFKVLFLEIDSIVLGIALDVGPRILYLASRDDVETNLFSIIPDIYTVTPEGVWRIYGGHRLWVAPESIPRTYSLDDRPVEVALEDGGAIVVGNPEHQNSVQKFIEVRDDGVGIEVVHKIKNIGRWPIEFSCWAVSVMRIGGCAIAPIKSRCSEQLPEDRCLLPDRSVTLWPYTKPTDRRLKILDNYVLVKHDPEMVRPLKVGININPMWVAYYVDGYMFVKILDRVEGVYPDSNSVVEIYTNNRLLELETLSPIKRVEPNAVHMHRERWRIARVGHLDLEREEDIDKVMDLVLGSLPGAE